jgi:hypothetical protein
MSEATVLTSENAADFYAQKLGLAADTPTEAETKPEPVVEEEKQSEKNGNPIRSLSDGFLR